jgi:hypothetical protein
MNKSLTLLLILLAFPLLSTAEQLKYRIGVLVPLSGDYAKYGETVRQGIEKIKNPQIDWVFEDEVCQEPAKAVSAYRKLSSVDKLSYFIGPCCGSPQKAIAPLVKNNQHLILLPNAAPSSVYQASGGKMYSVQYSLETEADFVADQMNLRGLKKVAIIYVDNDFSQTIEARFLKSFKGTVAFALRAPAFDVQYMKSAALKLKAVEFDSIFIPDASPLLLGFLSELRKIGLPARSTFAAYSAQMPDVLVSEKENAEGLLYSYPDVPNSLDALGYFPMVAAKLLADAVATCPGNYDCVSKNFANNESFGSDGTLSGKLVLKTVRNGKFVRGD